MTRDLPTLKEHATQIQLALANALAASKAPGIPMKLTASFTMPAVGATAVATTNTTADGAVGDWVWLAGAGWLAVTSIGGPTSVTLQNIPGIVGQAVPTTVIPSGTVVTPSGPGDMGVQGVFDVRRYGANPTDINAGFYSAMTALQANGGGSVYIPPLANGQVWQWATTTTGIGINLADAPGPPISCEVFGAGTIIQVTANTLGAALEIENATGHLVVRDLTFLGTLANSFDAGVVINLSGQTCEVERVNYVGIATHGTTFGALHISADVITVRCCNFSGSQELSVGGGTALLTLSGGDIHIHDLAFHNSCLFHSTTYNRGTGNGWIRIVSAQSVDIENCFLDTASNAPLQFASGPVSHVRIAGCTIRMPVTGGQTTITIDGSGAQIDTATIERCVFQQGVGGLNTIVAVNGCWSLYIENNSFAAADIHSVAVGANVGRLVFDGNVGNLSVDVTGGYPTVRYTVDGVDVPFRVTHAGSPYTLLDSQLNVLADVSGGAITLVVPATTTLVDGRWMTLIVPTGDASVNKITLNRSGADTLQDPAAIAAALGNTVIYATKGGSATWQACATEAQWRVVGKVV